MRHKNKILKRSYKRAMRVLKLRKMKKVEDIKLIYHEIPNTSDKDFLYTLLQEIFAKFGKKRPGIKINFFPLLESNLIRLKFQYLHQKMNLRFSYNIDDRSVLREKIASAGYIHFLVGDLSTYNKRLLFENLLTQKINNYMKGMRSEWYIIQELYQIIPGTSFSLEFNDHLDNLGIDVFLRYKDTKLGLSFQVKYRSRELSDFVPSIAQLRNEYLQERLHNEIIPLFIKNREDAYKYVPYIIELMNRFVKAHKLVA